MTILDQIDRATSGLCPCGAPPADGSAYCSDDCRPTHISLDTDTRETGTLATPMRWRPDLVTAASDDGLTQRVWPFRRRGFTAQVFDHPDGRVHLRLDDGHRYVGLDLVYDEWIRDAERAWQRLERELVNPRHTEPVDGDPFGDVFPATTALRTRRPIVLTGQLLTEADLLREALAYDCVEAGRFAHRAISAYFAGGPAVGGVPPTSVLFGVPVVLVDDLAPQAWRLIDSDGGVIGEGHIAADVTPQPANRVYFAPTNTPPADRTGWTEATGYLTSDGLAAAAGLHAPMSRYEVMARFREAYEQVRTRRQDQP